MVTHTQTLIQKYLDAVQAQGASDIHLASGRRPFLRIDGSLTPLGEDAPLTEKQMVQILIDLIGEEKARKILNREEIDFAYTHRKKYRFRGNAYVQLGNISLTMRAIGDIRRLADLNLPESLSWFTEQEQGFFLVVGPVGQGKSTTLAAMLDLINEKRREHIVTLENPIEYVYTEKSSIIDQREVGADTKSFKEGLEAAMRQDVNVILIGEMRTPENISAAVTAAETGHLVFSTLHTNNAAQTIDRIIDTFPSGQQNQVRAQISGSLLGVFSQRLLPSRHGGRVPAYELLINNTAISNLIREGRTHEMESVIETSRSEGMISMNQSLLNIIQQGHVSLEEAMRYSLDPEGLKRLIM